MISPARAHKLKEMAKQTAASRDAMTRGDVNAHELLLMQLAQHKRELKGIQSSERRLEHKAELMSVWTPYIDGWLAEKHPKQDSIIAQLMVWCFDISDIDRALAIGQVMIEQDYPAPEQFQRNTAAIVAEMSAEAWITAPADKPITAEQLQGVEELTAHADMVDEIRAKLYRAIGEALADSATETAVDYLERAVALNPRIGVKPLIAKLKKQVSVDSESEPTSTEQ